MIVISETGTVTLQLDTTMVRNTNEFVTELRATRSTEAAWNKRFVDGVETQQDHLVRAYLAEQAVAEYVDFDYRLEISDKARQRTDVDGIEVRAVRLLTHRLITQPHDKPAPYVLAVVDIDVATVVLQGWLHLRHCNVPAHWETNVPKPAYFTPPTALHPMDTLREHYHNRKRRLSNGI